MSERETPEAIPRISPEIRARLLGRDVILHYNNAALYSFAPDFDFVSHIYAKPDDWEKPVYMFGAVHKIQDSPLWVALQEANFPHNYAPYPTDQDLEVYMEFQSNQLTKDIEGL